MTRTSQLTARVAPWSGFEQVALDRGVRRRLFTAGRAAVVVCEIGSQAFSPDHAHPVEQVISVLAGCVEVRQSGRLERLEPGQATLIRAGVPHSVRALGEGLAETLNIFSPDR